MIRKLKMLGLALVAVFAMSSLVASAAFAVETLPDTDAIVSDSAPVKLTGDQENGLIKFTLAGQAVECTGAKISATIGAVTVTEVLTDEPTYTGCTYAGQEVKITMNGCKYRLTGTTGTDKDARAHVVCPVGNQIVITIKAIECEVFVASQEATEGYTITTVGSGTTKELTLHITAKVNVTSKGDPKLGVTCESLTKGTGTLSGTYLVTGETTTGEPPTHIGITDETLASTP